MLAKNPQLAEELYTSLEILRSVRPLIHHVTNQVSIELLANGLLALGASPVMADAVEEVEEMARISQAVVLNIGTLDRLQIQSAHLALGAASEKSIPVILDPVGAGATHYRTQESLRLLETRQLSVLRGNASEILALRPGPKDSLDVAHTKGVDTVLDSDNALSTALVLSKMYQTTIVVSGTKDIVVKASSTGKQDMLMVLGGHPWMSKVTGTGCLATSVIGAFLAVEKCPFKASLYGTVVMKVAGTLAAQMSSGPGSFREVFLDKLFQLTLADLNKHLLVELL